MRSLIRLLCFAAVLALAGCAVYQKQFTVETQPGQGREPLIHAPGTMPGDALSIRVPYISMACPQKRIAVCRSGVCDKLIHPDVVFSFELTQRLAVANQYWSTPNSTLGISER